MVTAPLRDDISFNQNGEVGNYHARPEQTEILMGEGHKVWYHELPLSPITDS